MASAASKAKSEVADATEAKAKPASAYEIGYGKPPAAHRFHKGKSGNPRGRPKGKSEPLGRRDLLAALSQAAREPIRVTKDGKACQTTRIDALAQQLTLQALKGDLRAAKLLLDTFKALTPANDQPHGSHEDWLAYLDGPPPAPPAHPGITVHFVSPGEDHTLLKTD